MCEEIIQINTLNLRFENTFNDEYFILTKGIENFVFEDKIYISNYGEVYNKTQDRLFEYVNCTINLKVINGAIRGFSRWNLTTNSFSMTNTDYESRRRLKKISYGYGTQNNKKDNRKVNIVKICKTNVIIDSEKDNIKQSNAIKEYHKIKIREPTTNPPLLQI
jgi:hypothetical protein